MYDSFGDHTLDLRRHTLDKSLFKGKDLRAVTPAITYLQQHGIQAHVGDSVFEAAVDGHERKYTHATLHIPAENNPNRAYALADLALRAGKAEPVAGLQVRRQAHQHTFHDAVYTLSNEHASVTLRFAKGPREEDTAYVHQLHSLLHPNSGF